MSLVVICDTYLALEMPECELSKRDWEALVRRVLLENGQYWPEISIDLFSCAASLLLIARPKSLGVKIAPCALRLLQDYFTE